MSNGAEGKQPPYPPSAYYPGETPDPDTVILGRGRLGGVRFGELVVTEGVQRAAWEDRRGRDGGWLGAPLRSSGPAREGRGAPRAVKGLAAVLVSCWSWPGPSLPWCFSAR